MVHSLAFQLKYMTTQDRNHIRKEYTCPKCNGELLGMGDNTIECSDCDFRAHEAEL